METSTKITKNICQLIGNTPLLHIPQKTNLNVSIYAKLEYCNPGGSVKDRAALNIINTAIQTKKIFPNSFKKTLIDATSGNTGIAYAMIGAALGIPVELALPENASPERKKILQAYNAKLHLTPAAESTDGAQDFVKKHIQHHTNYYYPDQYANVANWQAHYYQTGPEIWQQTKKKVTHFCCGIGTSGSFVGTSRYLKEQGEVTCIQLLPDSALHGLEGWKHLKTARVPEIYDTDIYDDTIEIDTERGYEYAIASSRFLGLFISPSSAANLYGAITLAKSISKGVIVTLLPDHAYKYLSEVFWKNRDYFIENPFF